jgi:hypothetical protein
VRRVSQREVRATVDSSGPPVQEKGGEEVEFDEASSSGGAPDASASGIGSRPVWSSCSQFCGGWRAELSEGELTSQRTFLVSLGLGVLGVEGLSLSGEGEIRLLYCQRNTELCEEEERGCEWCSGATVVEIVLSP